jgi:hypothetical protein
VDPLDRYVRAVEAWLPREQRDDIVAELADDLRSEVEEREAALGRPLDEAELGALLERRGHPMWVAEGYLPAQSLIGPVLLPIYLQVLKVVMGLAAVVFLGLFVAFRFVFPGVIPGLAGVGFGFLLPRVLVVALAYVGLITAIFALLERLQARARAKGRWDPARPDNLPGFTLQESTRARLRVRGTAAGDVATAVFTALCWVGMVPQLRIPGLSLSPAWRSMYVPVLVFLVAWALVALWVGWTGSWSRAQARARLAVDVLGLALAVVFAFGGPMLVVLPGAHHGVAMISRVVHLSVLWGVSVPAFFWLGARAVQDARRASGRAPLTNPIITGLAGN